MDADPDDELADPMPGRVRGGLVLLLVILALAHLLVPALPIDSTFLGLLALAAVVGLFDIERIEWLGIRARRVRRELAKAREDLDASPPPSETVAPPQPPAPLEPSRENTPPPLQQDVRMQTLATSRKPFDLEPPVEPLDRVLWALEQVRIELIILAGNAGRLPDRRRPWASYTAGEVADVLVEHGFLSTKRRQAIRRLQALRAAIVGEARAAPDVVERAADLGLAVLVAMREIPREYIRVRRGGILLYRDRSLSTPHETSGVELVTLTEEGEVLVNQVFPVDFGYRPSTFVAWEWNMERAFQEEAWYESEEEGGRPALAFSRAATFVGRPYPTQWGLEYRLPNPEMGL